jgi:DNA-binding FadR family transcriptional regulator
MLKIVPLQARTAVDDAADRLRTAILEGELEPGERLPPERQLAEQFGVGRVTVRSALGRLLAERLLKTRQGSGYDVLDFTRAAGPELLGALYELGSKERRFAILRDLLSVRRHLARALFERLADARPDLAPVHAAVDALEQATELDEIVHADLEIVRALCAASGSLVLQLCMNPVSDVLRALPPLQRVMFRAPEQNVAAYRMVLAWLESPDALPGVDVLSAVDAELQRHDSETIAFLEENP